jgi:glycogen phosphorylase
MIQEWTRFIRRPQTRKYVAFLSDYDVLMAEQMVQGEDLDQYAEAPVGKPAAPAA